MLLDLLLQSLDTLRFAIRSSPDSPSLRLTASVSVHPINDPSAAING